MYKKLLKNYKSTPGKRFAYNSATKIITYNPKELATPTGALALLHEIGHAKLRHHSYKYDLELLRMEQDAWDLAKNEAGKLNLIVDEDHIEECLRSYRKWASKRATCPKCKTYGLQKNNTQFSCLKCDARWRVNNKKDKRVMRKLINS